MMMPFVQTSVFSVWDVVFSEHFKFLHPIYKTSIKDRVLLHLGEAPSALTVDFDPTQVKKPAFALGAWRVPTHHANKLSGTLHALSRDWTSDGMQN
jgi:hypothetical protein